MSIKEINTGNTVNDGLGDDLRTAFEKVNSNFNILANQLAGLDLNIKTEILNNDGASIVEIQEENKIKFKSLISGRFIEINELPTSVEIRSTVPDYFFRIITDNGSIRALENQEVTIQGGDNVNVTAIGSTITVDTIKINNDSFKDILNNFDFGPITGNFKNTVQLAIAAANVDFGTFILPGSLNLDFGKIT